MPSSIYTARRVNRNEDIEIGGAYKNMLFVLVGASLQFVTSIYDCGPTSLSASLAFFFFLVSERSGRREAARGAKRLAHNKCTMDVFLVSVGCK